MGCPSSAAGAFKLRWKKKFFVMRKGTLTYCESPEDYNSNSGKAKVINLHGHFVLRDHPKHQTEFEIDLKTKRFQLQVLISANSFRFLIALALCKSSELSCLLVRLRHCKRKTIGSVNSCCIKPLKRVRTFHWPRRLTVPSMILR